MMPSLRDALYQKSGENVRVQSVQEVFDQLIDQAPTPISSVHQSGYGVTRSNRKSKLRLFGSEYEEVLANYWHTRKQDTPTRDEFITAAMDWAIYALLFENNDRGAGRNHEIKTISSVFALSMRLYESAERMVRDARCKIEMRPVCWWDVQENFHNIERKDIHRLAEDLHAPLLAEAIERLKERGILVWHSGVWTLSACYSRKYIQRLKARGRIFLAPEPTKKSGEYVA